MFYGSAGLQDIHVVGIKDGIDHLMETASLYESNSTPPRPQEEISLQRRNFKLYHLITLSQASLL